MSYDYTKHRALFAPELTEGMQDPRWIHEYPKRVLSGEITAGKQIKKAAERHFRDLERDDIYLDMTAAAHAVGFFKFIPITDGKDAGKPTILMGWQIWIVASLFGWKRKADGLFRYRQAYIQVGRKNGKTCISAGISLYKLLSSGYERPRGYCVATKREQAKELFEAAGSMIRLSPQLKRVFNTLRHEIRLPSKNGYFKPLASNRDSLDGLNPLMINLDEVHAYTGKQSGLYGVMVSALGAQPEPLMLCITTAGFELFGICKELYDNGRKVLDRLVEQDNYFYAIYEIDDEDEENWDDERLWIKANPAMGYHLRLDYLQQRSIEAKLSVTERQNFFVKHLNRFTTGGEIWLDIQEVKACRNDSLNIEDFKGRKCFVGIDKSLKNDLTSIALLFPTDDGGCVCFHENYLPEATLRSANLLQQQIYHRAIDKGDLTIVKGKTIRDEMLRSRLIEINRDFMPEVFAYDPWKMGEISEDLEERGIPMLGVGQLMSNMSEPATKLEALIQEQRFKYNCEIFEYCSTNAMLKINGQGNVRIEKEAYENKIDAIVATVIALSCATLNKVPTVNPYLYRGLLTI